MGMEREGQGEGKDGEIINTLKIPCFSKCDMWTSGNGILTRFADSESALTEEPLVMRCP